MAEAIKIPIGVDTRAALSSIKNFSKKSSSSLEGISRSVGGLTTSLVGLAAGFASIQGLRSAIQGVADFETAMTGVAKTTDLAGEDLENFGKKLRDLSTKIPIAANDLASIAESAGQLGVTGTENLILFTETVAKLGVATDLTGEAAATSIARILTVTGDGIGQVGNFGSVIVALGNNFAATESEIVSVTTEIAKATSTFKIGSTNAAGLATAMKQMGVRAELAGTVTGKSFRAIEAAIQQGGAPLENLIELTGLTGDELKKQFQDNATQVFSKFVSGLNKLSSETRSATSILEGLGLSGEGVLKTLPALSNNYASLEKALALANKESKKAGALNKEAAKAFSTLNSEIEKTTNVIKNRLIRAIEDIAPALKKALKAARALLETEESRAKREKDLTGLSEVQLEVLSKMTDEERERFAILQSSTENRVAFTELQEKIAQDLTDEEGERLYAMRLGNKEREIAVKLEEKRASVSSKPTQKATASSLPALPPLDLDTNSVELQDGFAAFEAGAAEFAGAAAGVAKAILEAPKIVKEVASTFNQVTDLPADLLDAFGQLDVAIERFVTEFPEALISNLPGIIEAAVKATAEQLPKLIEVLTDPEFLQALTEALVQGGIEISLNLAKKAPEIGANIVIGMLTGGLERIGLGIANGIVNGIESSLAFDPPPWINKLDSIISDTPPWIKKLQETLDKGLGNPVGDAGGTGQGLVPDSVPILGKLANGGIIPTGFPNDSFAAGLTSGERVLRNDEVTSLNALQGQLSILTQMVQQPMRVSTTAQVNGQAFADIVLELDRNNARLSA